ncbi:MAG: outer membrane beta-barrel protein [Saprospiraceae bacterium]
MEPSNRLKNFLLVLCLLHCSYLSFSQVEIRGLVLSSEGNPIEFATVALLDTISNNIITGEVTDYQGRFLLKINHLGNYLLTIHYLGYDRYSQFIGSTDNLDLGKITLVESINNLSEAVVTAEKNVISKREDQLVFDIAASTLNNGYDGIEVLEQTPYVWIDENDNIQMRNQGATIQVNGRLLNLRGADLANYIRNLRSENIKSIEVQTTPSASADADNIGGIINIVLKEKIIGFNSNLRISHRFYGDGYYQLNPNANFNYGADKWNIYGSYNFTDLDNNASSVSEIKYKKSGDYLQTSTEYFDQTKRHNYQVGFVIAPWEKHEFGVEAFGGTSNRSLKNDGILAFTNATDTIDKGTIVNENDIARSIYSTIINYTWKMDTLNSTLKILLDRTQQTNKDDNGAISNYDLSWFSDNEIRNLFDNKTNIYSAQIDVAKYFASGMKTEFGVKHSQTNRDNELVAEDKIGDTWLSTDRSADLNYKENISATYLNLSKLIHKRHFIKIGLRTEFTDLKRTDFILTDTINQSYLDWFPYAYYSLDLKKLGNLSASYSRRLSRPAFQELNNNVRKVNDFRFIIGNPDLRPEYISLFELQWQRKKQTISIYSYKADDAINGIYFLEDSIAFYQRQNNGAQKQFGLEYNLSKEWTDWFSTRAATHFYHRKYTNDEGEDSFERSTVSIRFYSTFKLNKSSSVDFNIRYQSKTEDAFYIREPFYNFNLVIKKSFWNKKLNCRLYINDLFNNYDNVNSRPFDEIITRSARKPRSRFITLWMSYNFSNNRKWKQRKNNTANDVRRRI